MTRALFVGDGPRDAATIPKIVENQVDIRVSDDPMFWHDIRVGGFKKKLQYALARVRDRRKDALIAVVDSDREKTRKRLAKLEAGRDADRQKLPRIPCALGEARPHGDAWLLDDPVAVCDALGIHRDTKIPASREAKDRRKVLNDVIATSPKANDNVLDVLAAIAARLDPSRCLHGKETGFKAFLEEVESELRQ